ncbi:MAG: hypothetical protein R3F54_03365 [Alphaproteobacteria bacterium]
MVDTDILKEHRIQDYIDDRQNERDRASVAAYLLANPDVGAAVERLRRQNEALKAMGQEILDEPVPERLRSVIGDAKVGTSPASVPAAEMPPAPRLQRRPFLEAAAAILLFIVGGAVGWFLHDKINPLPSDDDLLTSQIVYAYEFYDRERDYPIDFAADRVQDFDGWISRSFTRSLPPPDLARYHFTYAGGRLVPSARIPVAQFQFENDHQQRLGLFFWQGSAQAIRLPQLADDKRTMVKIWIEGDLSLALISDRDNPDFDAIANDVSTFYRRALSAQ